MIGKVKFFFLHLKEVVASTETSIILHIRIASEEFEITEEECCLYLRQICRGVEYLHKQNILHLDLKVKYGKD